MTIKEYNNSIKKWGDSLYRFVLSQSKNTDFAKDVVQDTYEKVWLRHKDISYEKVKSYLFKAAYHTMLDGLKKNKRWENIENVSFSPSTETHHNFDIQRVLHQALDQLPEIQKTVILLRDYEGYNYEEIAEITSLKLSQVKVYIFRARQKMKVFLVSTDIII